DTALGEVLHHGGAGVLAALTDPGVLAQHRLRRRQLVRAVVLQAGRAASADHEVHAHADRRDDRDRADDDGGLLAAAARGGGLGRHAVRGLAVGRLLAVRGLLRRDTGLAGLLRVAVPGLSGRRCLLGVAVAGLRSL